MPCIYGQLLASINILQFSQALAKIKTTGMNKSDLVRQEDSNIVIDIPGMEPLTIHSVKFHSNMLSGKRDDLKIKTR